MEGLRLSASESVQHFLGNLMVLTGMNWKVISMLFCNVTTSADGSQEKEAAQEITLMDQWNEKLVPKADLLLILFISLE